MPPEILAEGAAPAGLAEAAARLRPGDRAVLHGFEGPAARARLAAALAARGVAAEVLPAWGGARDAFAGARMIEAPARLLAELWPPPEGLRLRLAPPGAPPVWRVDGRAVPAPLRPAEAPGGGRVLAACGRIAVEGRRPETLETGLATALAALLAAAARAFRAPPRPGRPPPELRLRLEADFEDPRLAEAMHEELHFGALEILRARAGADPAARDLPLGAVIPEIVHAPASPRVRWRAAEGPAAPATDAAPLPVDLERLARPATEGEVRHALAALIAAVPGARPRSVPSQLGRGVPGALLPGAGPAILLTAAQHGNEPTGVVGALLAARALAAEGAALALAPLENPDGAALHARLLRDWPGHMHHAARPLADGRDVQAAPDAEGALRHRLAAESGARLHLNLHGYPAGPWLRPFTGGPPRGFEDWALPRGVFLILRAAPGWQAAGEAALAAAARALSADPEIAALTRRQRAWFRRLRPDAPEETRIAEIPVLRRPALPGAPCPVEIVTETPDETVAGARFRLLVRAQTLAALAAARDWRRRAP